MLMAEKLGPMKLPERESLTAAAAPAPSAPGAPTPGGAEAKSSLDFDSILSSSNADKKVEQEKEQAAAGGDLRAGESKSDKDFRQMLEKVTGKKQDKLKTKLEKDDYLNLMVTQLKHQDPTKPMDNQEMATQLAQFNTVEQLMGVNKTLGEMKAQSNAADVGKLSPYLGRNVEVGGDKLVIKPDRAVTDVAVKLPAGASAVSVTVKDATGAVVRTVALGDRAAGTHKLNFDGKDDKGNNLNAGAYTFAVEAVTADGKPIDALKIMNVKVDGIVDLAAGGKLETNAGAVDVKYILAIRANDEVKPEAVAKPAQTASAPAASAPAAEPKPAVIAPGPATQQKQAKEASAKV